MKTLYTLIIAVMLVGCNPAIQEARSSSSAFLHNCKDASVITNIKSNGETKTLTITCEKDGN